MSSCSYVDELFTSKFLIDAQVIGAVCLPLEFEDHCNQGLLIIRASDTAVSLTFILFPFVRDSLDRIGRGCYAVGDGKYLPTALSKAAHPVLVSAPAEHWNELVRDRRSANGFRSALHWVLVPSKHLFHLWIVLGQLRNELLRAFSISSTIKEGHSA